MHRNSLASTNTTCNIVCFHLLSASHTSKQNHIDVVLAVTQRTTSRIRAIRSHINRDHYYVNIRIVYDSSTISNTSDKTLAHPQRQRRHATNGTTRIRKTTDNNLRRTQSHIHAEYAACSRMLSTQKTRSTCDAPLFLRSCVRSAHALRTIARCVCVCVTLRRSQHKTVLAKTFSQQCRTNVFSVKVSLLLSRSRSPGIVRHDTGCVRCAFGSLRVVFRSASLSRRV